ncbi:MAG: DUF1512 family protein, partial [Candidatus Aenigmatarchaeota archaeon]
FFVESYLTEKKIPIDAIAIKMKSEEALMPMRREILKAQPAVDEAVKRSLKEAKGKVILAGIGVTVGVGNDKRAAEAAEKVIDSYNRKVEREKREKEKNKGFWAKMREK